MSKPEWSEKKVLESWKAFWSTIGQTIDTKSHKSIEWRRVVKNGLDVSAYFARESLDVVVDLLMNNRHIADNYTHNAIGGIVAERTIGWKANNSCFSEDEAKALVSELVDSKPHMMIVYMPVYGISIHAGQRLSVGQFTFIAGDTFDSLGIHGCHSKTIAQIKDNVWKRQPHVFVPVSACDPNRAREKAIEEFQWLENAVRLFIDSKFFDFGITTYNFSHIENTIVTQSDGLLRGTSSRLKGSREQIPLMELFDNGFILRRVVATLGVESRNLSEYQKRIRQAIALGGLAAHETVASVSFFLEVSALEALFQAETDKYVSSSIAQQIVESFCFLMVDDEHRRATFEEMRSFYRKRSAIAHGGSTEITDQDVRLVRNYLRHAIGKLLTDPNLSKIQTIQELSEMVKGIKFGKK